MSWNFFQKKIEYATFVLNKNRQNRVSPEIVLTDKGLTEKVR